MGEKGIVGDIPFWRHGFFSCVHGICTGSKQLSWKNFVILCIIIIIIYPSGSWATCWPVPVSRI